MTHAIDTALKAVENMDAGSPTPGPWAASASATSVWATGPLRESVKIASITVHPAINGIDHKANARLIAAAPDMLLALERMLQDGSIDLIDLDMVRHVVNKVRGEA